MPPVRSKAAIVVIIYITLFIFFYILLRNEQVNGRVYDSRGKTCLSVTDDLKLTRYDTEECEAQAAQWAFQTDGGFSTLVYYAPDGPQCLTNLGDGSVALKTCTGENNQQWSYAAEKRIVSNYSPDSPLEGNYCLTSQSSLLGGNPVGVARCRVRPSASQTWNFAADSSVFNVTLVVFAKVYVQTHRLLFPNRHKILLRRSGGPSTHLTIQSLTFSCDEVFREAHLGIHFAGEAITTSSEAKHLKETVIRFFLHSGILIHEESIHIDTNSITIRESLESFFVIAWWLARREEPHFEPLLIPSHAPTSPTTMNFPWFGVAMASSVAVLAWCSSRLLRRA